MWAELVRRARSGDPAWVVGLVGVAMPGLRRAAATLSASYRGDPDDLQTEILTGFLAALRALDPDDLDRRPAGRPGCAGPPGGPGRATHPIARKRVEAEATATRRSRSPAPRDDRASFRL